MGGTQMGPRPKWVIWENLEMATTNVSSASELKAALASAKGGDTILVKSGSYGWVNLDNVKFNDYVTIKSADGNGGAVFKHIGLYNTSHIRLDSLTVEFGATPLHNLKAIEVRKTDHLQVVNSEIIGHAATKDWKELPRGIHVWDGSSDIELSDNHFHHLSRAVVIQGVNNVDINNNLVDKMHSDGFFFQNSRNLLIENNLLTDFNRTGGVHADYIQFDPGTSGASRDVVIRGNVMLKGNGNGDVQGIFGGVRYLDVLKKGFANFLIEDNIYFDTGLNSIQLHTGENMTVRNNTVLTDPADGRVGWVRLTGPQTNSVIENNVALQVTAEGGATASGNVIVQYKDPSKANYYGKLFADAFADPATLADLAPKSGTPIAYGSGKGAEKLFQELLGGGGASPANTAPVAEDDTAVTQQGLPVTIKVLANDSDADGDALTVASVGQAANGTVKLNADGTATYTPAAGFTGSDGFTYTVSDGRGGTDTARATVSVAAAAIPAPGTIPTPLLASEAKTFNGTKGAALVLPHQQAYEVASGTLELAFTADAISGRRALFSKDAINFGTGGHFTIQIEDGALVVRMQSKTQSFTVTAKDAITAGHQHHAAITFGSEGLKLYLDGVLTGTNANTGGLTGNAEPVVIGASQAISGQKVADVLTDFFAGTIAKVALYNQALPAAAIAKLNEEGVSNTAPVAGDDTASTVQGSPVTIKVLANDHDADGDALTVASVGQAAGGTVKLNADGTATYTPATGFTGSDGFTYTVSDGRGGTDTGTVAMKVGGAAPVVVPAINAGGGNANGYSADKYVSGGKTFSTKAAIAGTDDDALYQSERYGNFSYAVPVANGTYDVTLQFAEIYWNAAGKRLFDVKAEGKLILDDLDIFSAAGGKNIAYDVTVPVAVSDGILNLDFITVKDNAKISAIQIANVLGDSSDAIAKVALYDNLVDLADPLLL